MFDMLPFKKRKFGFKKTDGADLNDTIVVKKPKKRNGKKIFKKVLRYTLYSILTLMLVSLIVSIILSFAFYLYVKNYIDADMEEFNYLLEKQHFTTMVYYLDENGNLVELEDQRIHSSENRVWVKYNDIPENLKNAFIAIEDKRFYKHDGVDWLRSVRAAFYFLIGKQDSGGSTITQQLIKNITLEDANTIQRKVQEILRALELEKTKDKSEILELYLNTIYFSEGSYGVEAAAHTYFSKSIQELDLIECAALAAITQAPTKWNPILNPQNNKARRNLVLKLMYEQGMITQEEFESAFNKELKLNVSRQRKENKPTSWYTDAVIEEAAMLLSEKYKISRDSAINMIYTGGLKIITAQDPDVQRAIDEVYENTELFKNKNGEVPQSSVIVIDPYTGNILGLAGGVGKKTESRILNRATQTRRSPGSAIKPVSVFAPALEKGIITYGTVYDDVPVSFDKKGNAIVAWPVNSPSVYGGLTTVHSAVTRSVNTVAVRVLKDLGIPASYDFLVKELMMESIVSESKANGKYLTDKNLSALALGGMTYGVTLKEITTAYSIFVNSGVYTSSRTVLKILDSNNVEIIDNTPKTNAAISEETAQIMTKMLQSVVSSGTAAQNITLDKYIDVAGKTGTTSNGNDKLFIGYTPYYLGGVWLGFDEPKTISGYTGNHAAEIWNEVMLRVHEKVLQSGEKLKKFEYSDKIIKVTYCRDSGKLATEACLLDPRGSRLEVGYFKKGTAPKDYCDCHIVVNYCNEGHGIASEYCPVEATKKVGLIRVNRDFPIQVYVTDAQYVYIEPAMGKTVCADPRYPLFQFQIPEGRYVGITNTDEQYNHYCTEHYSGQPYGFKDFFYYVWKPVAYDFKYAEKAKKLINLSA